MCFHITLHVQAIHCFWEFCAGLAIWPGSLKTLCTANTAGWSIQSWEMDSERYMLFREHLLASLSGAAALAVTDTALHQIFKPLHKRPKSNYSSYFFIPIFRNSFTLVTHLLSPRLISLSGASIYSFTALYLLYITPNSDLLRFLSRNRDLIHCTYFYVPYSSFTMPLED